MTAFYAIILDWELAPPVHPQIRLVATAQTVQALEAIDSFDPSGPSTTIITSDFTITPVKAHSVENQYTGADVPAQICELKA